MKNHLKITFLLAAAWALAACGKEEGGHDAPLAAGAMEVRGNLVDIRTLAAGEKVFPQHDDYLFDEDAGMLFEEPTAYAAGLMESRGAEAFRCGSAGTVRLATDCADMQAEGWAGTDEVLMVGDIPYRIYTHAYATPGKWTPVPDPEGRKYTTLLFAPQLRVADVRTPGTVIAQVPELRGRTISNVSLAILPNGDYLASCTGVSQGASLFVSEDRGASWRMLVENVTERHCQLLQLVRMGGETLYDGVRPRRREPDDRLLGGQRTELDVADRDLGGRIPFGGGACGRT